MKMDNEWELSAVVGNYGNTSSAAATTDTTIGNATTTMNDYDDPYYKLEALVSSTDDNIPFPFPGFGEKRSGMTGGLLEEVYKEGCGQTRRMMATAAATATATSSSSVISMDGGGFVHEQLPMLKDSPSFSIHDVDSQSIRGHRTKRKNQQKKMVLQLTQEELSSDTWAWRKYGQKPIKGSPYPRNYYRCSTTKACGARKQVERSPMDPSVFIVSYSGEHIHPRPTHRSSLAGSTRSNKFNTDTNKPPAASGSSAATAMADQSPGSPSSPPSGSSFSPPTSLKGDDTEMNEEDEDDDEDILIPNVVMNNEEVLLKGFQNWKGGGSGTAGGF